MLETAVEPAAIDEHSVTAIIATYNRAAYLRESLFSVLGQTLPPHQVIVMDDGSHDATPDVVGAFGSRVLYLRKPNGGKASALNIALRHTTGGLVWIFDDDDIADPRLLELLVAALRDHPQCGFAYGDAGRFTDGSERQWITLPPAVHPDHLFIDVLLGGYTGSERRFVFQPASLVRKRCYDEVGPFDEALIRSQDFEMLTRLAHRYQAVKVEKVVFHARIHKGIRGSQGAPVTADDVVSAWLRNDGAILTRIYQTCPLCDFFPDERSADLTPEQQFTAFVQRAGIMARKGLWEQAALDLERAAAIARTTGKRSLDPRQEEILRSFFDLFSFAPHTFRGAARFRRALNNIEPKALQRGIRAALLWPVPLTVGAALVNRQYRNFCSFVRAYFLLARPFPALRTLFSRAFLAAGAGLLLKRVSRRPVKSVPPVLPAALLWCAAADLISGCLP